MYIILGAEHNALHFLVPEKCMNTANDPIIIADIAPWIPGSLTHFNWPRLLRKAKIQGFDFIKTYNIWI